MNIGVVGLGMIGGSIAKGLKKNDKTIKIYASDIDENALEQAKKDGNIDVIVTDNSFDGCDVIFVAVPCGKTIDTIKQLASSTSAIITDVASVKGRICSECEGVRFIGGHPMAGVEKGGYAASKPHMFENAFYALVGKKTSEDYKKVEKLVKKLGAIPYNIDAEEHDKVAAMISHMPHMVAFALTNTALTTENAKRLAAGGFKDITRIASSDSSLWTEITMLNKHNIANAMDKLIEQLTLTKAMLVSGKATSLEAYMQSAKEKRDNLDSKISGAISKAFELSVDVEDKVGTIGKITGLLAKRKVSIANITIENSREGMAGVLKIGFFNRQAREDAEKILKEGGIECLGI